MNYIALAIAHYYNAQPLVDFVIEEVPDPDTGETSTVITAWNLPDPQPTIEQVETYISSPAFQAALLTRAKNVVMSRAQQLAQDAENQIDNLISGNYVRAIMLNTEITHYAQAGRPTNPSANVYVISAAIAARRALPLRDTLESLFTRWRTIQGRISAIVTELDRIENALDAAQTLAEIQAIEQSINFD
ncbi:MAG: hypothetical protein KDJ52_01700 [Anaerolineae bacterium]|nr:hypothetical protein [Anaerolineae bacterium]